MAKLGGEPLTQVRAKVGTHSSCIILLVSGELELGSLITFLEPDGKTDPQWLKPHRGLIDQINADGLIFVERM